MQGSQLVRRTWGLPAMLLAVLAGCNADSAADTGQPAQDNPVVPVVPVVPAGPGLPWFTISGIPSPSIEVGMAYTFTPSVTNGGNSRLGFSVQNKPSWASFDATTGRISGMPGPADAGTYTRILVTVTDGTASASLPQFQISVTTEGSGSGAASLSWMPPTRNADGTPLTNLTGYRIYYGNAPDALTQRVTVNDAEVTNYVIANLSAGAWYFALKAYNNLNEESDLSEIVSKTI